MSAELVDTIPLSQDASGVYRVGKTRVTLDLIVKAFNRGATAEEIAQDYPSVSLPDIYQVIGYYLKHAAELDSYLAHREAKENALLVANEAQWRPLGLRERLLARRRDS